MIINVNGVEYDLENLTIEGNTNEDREMVINANPIDKEITVYTSDNAWLTKIKKCITSNPAQWRIVKVDTRRDGSVRGVIVKAPKNGVILKGGKIRPLTEEQKEARIHRLREYNKKRAEEKNS